MDRTRDHLTETHYGAPHVHGPLKLFNPTKRHIPLPASKPDDTSPGSSTPQDTSTKPSLHTSSTSRDNRKGRHALGVAESGIYHVWRSRDNRKGRHAIVLTDGAITSAGVRPTSHPAEISKGILRMLIRCPIWDISYDVAMLFTIGSVVWCINGFFAWYPLYRPSTLFSGEDVGAGWTAMIGATIFEVGAVMGVLEAVNENRTDCFGWALEKAVTEEEARIVARHNGCQHHHGSRRTFLGGRLNERLDRVEADGVVDEKGGDGRQKRRFTWCPTWYELRTHYFRELGFLAAFIQLLGATIFWVPGIVGIPQILERLSGAETTGVYWLLQVVGGSGFIISSAMLMLEVQSKWWKPNLKSLGWHIGFWNWIGGIGFTLCGALGFGASDPSVNYAATLATFIGSWAFLVSCYPPPCCQREISSC